MDFWKVNVRVILCKYSKCSMKEAALGKLPFCFVGFKMKPLIKSISYVTTKANSNFTGKHAERNNRSCSVYLMNHLFRHLYSNIGDDRMYRTLLIL